MKRTLVATVFIASCLLVPASVTAFCGFYVAGGDARLFNNATQVALLRQGTHTSLAMQNSYQGPPEAFAMVVPVPQVLDEANVKTLEKEVFDRLDQMTAPRLVEYSERDPCHEFYRDALELVGMTCCFPCMLCAPKHYDAPMMAAEAVSEASDYAHGVEVKSKFKVGEYDIVILSANNSSGLERWLRKEHYAIPAGAEPYLRPYVTGGSYFFVAKVDPTRVTFVDGRAVLSPLRFDYTSEEFVLPIRLGMINSNGEQDLIVYVMGDRRYELANYKNALIPTNLQVTEQTRESFGSFYQGLFAETVQKNPGAVITEYSWGFTKCDPCPGPTLGPTELVALGVPQDQVYNMLNRTTITRLHARYKPDQIGEDLVFRAADALYGGREVRIEDTGGLEMTGRGGGVNNFQGRYIIRHRWVGMLMCPNPEFGHWEEPSWFNKGGGGGPATAPSANTAESPPAPASPDELREYLEQGVPELGIPGGLPLPFTGRWWVYVLGYASSAFVLGVVGWVIYDRRRRRKRARNSRHPSMDDT